MSRALVVGLGLAGCSTLPLYGVAPLGWTPIDDVALESKRSEAPKHSFH